MPRGQRAEPLHVQIANHFRSQILDGELAPGDRLPTIAAIADEWQVSAGTVSKALSWLQVEGAVWASPEGTFVSGNDTLSRTPGERIRAPRPARARNGEVVVVNEAHIVTAPDYVAGLLGMEPGSQVVRREEVTSLRGHARMLSVDWVPADDVRLAAELTSDQPIQGGPERLIADITGRRVTHSQDHLRGRAADAREAGALGLRVGTPILAGVHVWSDPEGPIMYGEWVMPPDQVIMYEYEVSEPPAE